MPDLKSALKKATPGVSAEDESSTNVPSTAEGNSDLDDGQYAEKYLLRVTAGPSYDARAHYVVDVNGKEPTSFESDAMSVQVRVRIKDYNGGLLSVVQPGMQGALVLTPLPRATSWLA